jgi:hypothetical protein
VFTETKMMSASANDHQQLLDIGAEEEVLAPAGLDNIIEARLVDREGVAVPGVNARLGDIDDNNLN